MKDSKYFKISSVLAFVMLMGGTVFFLTSASSVKESNSQSITKLSADLADIHAEYEALLAEENDGSIAAEPYLGEIAMFGFNFTPRGWAQCNGQLLPIAQNDALFSLLGTQYGGDGRTTFGLPDLRGRVAINQGNGPGLNPRRLGQKFGGETNSILTTKAGVGSGGGSDDVIVVSDIPPFINVMMPSLTVNYCIALVGVYPSRS